MKKKSSRLKPVEQLAESRAQTATEEMLSARNSHRAHEQKLTELESYRLEYIEQFQSRAKNGMQSTQLQQYQQFISQLENAIKQQRLVVVQALEMLDHRQNHWRDKDSHKRAINKAVGRFKQQESLVEQQIEQDDLDEHNTQQHNQKTKHKL
jgi:flagellar FliJ protein